MAKSYDYLYKILLIGDSDVGKTQILSRFADDFSQGDFIATIEIDFKTRVVDVDGARIKLQLWDTSGQERFFTLTSSYYRGISGVLLVYDVTNKTSFENIKKWMEIIIQQAPQDVEIMLLGNNCETVIGRQVSYDDGLAMAYEYNITFMEVDPIISIYVEEAFMSLTRNIKLKQDIKLLGLKRLENVENFIDAYRSPLKKILIEIFGKDSLRDILKSHSPFIRDMLYAIIIQTTDIKDSSVLDTITNKCGISGIFSNLDDVIRYSEALRAGVREEICIKSFVLGTTGAGKTSLSKAIEKENCYNESPPKTVVLDIHESHLDENITLKLFDAGGDSEYYLLSTQFLHSECIFIIVVDGTTYSKNLFQPCIGVYLDVIVADCQSGYLYVVVTKQDDDNFKFLKEDAVHIELQIQSYLRSHGSNLLFTKDNIWKMTTRDKTTIDSFRNELRRVIIEDNDVLDKRRVPYNWSKFVENLKSPVMEYEEIKQSYNNFSFPESDDNILQVSNDDKKILIKLEDMLKVYLKVSTQNIANTNKLIKGQAFKEHSETETDNKSENVVDEKVISKKGKFKFPSNLFSKKKAVEPKDQVQIDEREEIKLHAADTILRFYRNRGRLIWLENLKKSVFTEPMFLLEMLRSVIRHDLSTHLIKCKLSNLSIREIEERGLLNMDDIDTLMKSAGLEQRLPDRNAKEFLVDILTAVDLASQTLDGKLFVPALVQNNDLEFITSTERNITQNYRNSLTIEVELDKCGTIGMYMRMLVKLKNKKVILQKLFSQKIEMRTNGIVSGVEGTIMMKKKDGCIEEFSFLFLEKELVIDTHTKKDVDRIFGGENAVMASFRTITIYITHISGSDTNLWNVLEIFKNIIINELQELEKTRKTNPKFRIYCYGCCMAKTIGYFDTDSDFRIRNNTDLCSGKDERHHLASFEEGEKKWMWNPANKGEITELFTNQNISEYANKRSFNELYATLERGDQIWYYKKAGENKLALGNAYAHVMVYVGNDEVVHVYKPKLSLPLIAHIEKHHIDRAIPIDVRDQPNFFLGHEVLNSLPVANEKEMIADKALACLKHGVYPVMKFNYNAITTNCETFANALLGKFGYCEQACGLNQRIKRVQGAVNPLIKGLNLTRNPLMQQIQERLATCFEEDEKKWMWNPANKGEITELFANQNISEYANKRSFDELYATSR